MARISVSDDSYRAVAKNMPSVDLGVNEVVDNAAPGDRVEALAVRTDDSTGAFSVGDQGTILFSTLYGDEVAVLWDHGTVSYLYSGDELKVIAAGSLASGTVPVVELHHDTTMWNEGFENADYPYLVVPVSDMGTAERLADWANKNFRLGALPYPVDSFGFTAKVSVASSRTTLDEADAEDVIKDIVSLWQGI